MPRVRMVLQFVEQLMHEPGSHLAAELAGGMQFLGWDHNRILLADIRDSIAALITGLAGEKWSDDFAYPRPQIEAPADALTIADFNVAAFERWIGT